MILNPGRKWAGQASWLSTGTFTNGEERVYIRWRHSYQFSIKWSFIQQRVRVSIRVTVPERPSTMYMEVTHLTMKLSFINDLHSSTTSIKVTDWYNNRYQTTRVINLLHQQLTGRWLSSSTTSSKVTETCFQFAIKTMETDMTLETLNIHVHSI